MDWGDFLLGAVAYKFFCADSESDKERRRQEDKELKRLLRDIELETDEDLKKEYKKAKRRLRKIERKIEHETGEYAPAVSDVPAVTYEPKKPMSLSTYIVVLGVLVWISLALMILTGGREAGAVLFILTMGYLSLSIFYGHSHYWKADQPPPPWAKNIVYLVYCASVVLMYIWLWIKVDNPIVMIIVALIAFIPIMLVGHAITACCTLPIDIFLLHRRKQAEKIASRENRSPSPADQNSSAVDMSVVITPSEKPVIVPPPAPISPVLFSTFFSGMRG